MIGRIRWFEHADFALLVNAGIDIMSGNINIVFNANGKVLGSEQLEVVSSVYQQIIQAVMIGQEPNLQVLHEQVSVLSNSPINIYDDYDRNPMMQRPDEIDLKSQLSVLWLKETGYKPGQTKPDSLSILRLSARIESELGIKIPLHIMFHTDAFGQVFNFIKNTTLTEG
ncbi:acyl carrier protein [Xenorhabdus sp. TH1]|uniref:acyl carrier protein n=1 Tax=Xenorhabdus sp. TH1 TaxID=3130166 RepID=UPI0030CD19AB